MKRTGLVLLLLLWVGSWFLLPVSAAGEVPDVSATAAVVMEAETGQVLYGKNEDASMVMASTTKILTALLALESGNLDLPFTVDSDAIQVEGTSMGLQPGDQATLRTLACGMLLSSGNDAANAAAVRIAGSLEEFAVLMNQRAAQLGMTGSSFVTPSGLDAQGHYTTAKDMALLTRTALQNPDFAAICSQKSMKVSFGNPPAVRWLSNHNRLLSEMPGCVGVKTGFTKLAGRCLVSAACRDGVTLICVTLKAPNDWDDHKKLMNWGFDQLETVFLTASLTGVVVPVGGSGTAVPVVQRTPVEVVLPAGSTGQLEEERQLPSFVYGPVKAGEPLGEVRWYLTQDGQRQLVASATLTAGADVALPEEKIPLLRRMIGWCWRFFHHF